jgi:two-component system nitrate/nitrite response regulator NarL
MTRDPPNASWIAPAHAAPAPASVRVAVVTDVLLYREALTQWLSSVDSMDFAGDASSLEEAVDLLQTRRPSVVVVDMGSRDSVALVRGLRAATPEVKLVAFAVTEREDELMVCAEAGVNGFVTREASSEQLVSAVQSAARGELLCSPRIAALLFECVGTLSRRRPEGPSTTVPFSEREREIGILLAEGLANKEIAVRLRIEVATVKNHVHGILTKLRVTNRTEAAAYFRMRLR